MGNSLEDFALQTLSAVIGADEVNEILINKLVNRARNRPHPWTTQNDYISWSGLTDRSFSARMLPAKPYPANEALGTRRPPLAEVVKLFHQDPAGQRPCPKSTLLFPAFAQYLTDGFLRTEMQNDPPWGTGVEDRRRTTSNHEIDQSPLYGRTPQQTDVLREKSNVLGKKGRLKSQLINGEAFPPYLLDNSGKVKAEFCDAAGKPILDMPLGIDRLQPNDPKLKFLFAVGGDRVNSTTQVSMMNTLWLREHNRLAGLLEGRYPAWDDDRLFETARNIIIVMFIKIVVEEYINHINTSVFKFRADPRVAWKADWNRPNWMTTEFSLLYRWHSLIPRTLTLAGQPVASAALLMDNEPLVNMGLASAFAEISANNATELGLQNTADILIRAEENSIKQARTNNLASYNDYRRAMDMDPAKTFDDIVGTSKNPAEKARRKALGNELKRLYGTVENVEFFVGLFAEPREKNGPVSDLVLAMVALDAFSQALTNPLLSEHVYGNEANRKLAFSPEGLAEIATTKKLRDILLRNSSGLGERFVGMTRRDWQRD